jgi:sulfhydrogenase subunit beta (sulfur reductase)
VQRFTIEPSGFDALIRELVDSGHRVYGPVLSDGSIRYRPISGIDDLPHGMGDEQGPGRYRLVDRGDDALFGYVVGPSSLKDLLFPPRRTVWTATRADGRLEFRAAEPDEAPIAVIGARACELAAMAVQDHVLAGGRHRDPDYVARRSSLFVVAVNCTTPAATCFCASMGTGPAVTSGFDLALTEIVSDGHHLLVGEIGTERGESLVERVPHRPATTQELADARFEVAAAGGRMTRALQTAGLRDLLAANPLSGRWNLTAERCLACGNCTQVCPTCFCTSTEDGASLDGTEAWRERRWDSCFGLDFSYMGGGPMRATVGARYRQWLTHKLSTWVDQFGEFGCVGCGRCITWCPVGIDLTEEVSAIRATEVTHV